jgi:type II secretory pathway component GspD/PulD (secretin)
MLNPSQVSSHPLRSEDIWEAQMNQDIKGSVRINSAMLYAALTLALTLVPCKTHAQTAESHPEDAKQAEARPTSDSYQTLYLTDTEQRQANDLVTDLRNMVPRAKVFYLQSQGAISIRGTNEDMQLAQKIIAAVDRVKKTYRLTYTLTETDGGKSTGTQHVSLVVIAGAKSVLKEGTRVPIVTGTLEAGSSTSNTQVQYLDIGLNIDASLEEYAGGVRLRSKIEQSNVAEEKSGMGAQDPVIRQTMLEGTSPLIEGKPLILGTLDLPGSTRHQEVAVVSELVK